MKKRELNYEIIRTVSMFFVISVHLLRIMPTDTELRTFMFNVFNLLFLTWNVLYVKRKVCITRKV